MEVSPNIDNIEPEHCTEESSPNKRKIRQKKSLDKSQCSELGKDMTHDTKKKDCSQNS